VAELDAAVSRPDPRDWTSLPTGSATPAARFSGRGLRVGVLESMGYGFDVAEDVRARVSLAATLLHEAGAHVEQVAPPFRRNPAAPLDRLLQGRTLAQVAALPAPDRPRVLGAVTAWCADAARYSATQAAADGAAAQAATARFAAAVEPYDLVVSPVVPLAAFPAEWVGLDAAVPLTHLAFTLWWSQMGAPLATVCLGFDTTGHPIGVQLAGRRFADAALLSAAAHLERERDFILDWPITPRRGRTP
jgi:Asp-tRNA(Asn)/Glu-tRNA(Gln) amidotransferase A subunit family amidase